MNISIHGDNVLNNGKKTPYTCGRNCEDDVNRHLVRFRLNLPFISRNRFRHFNALKQLHKYVYFLHYWFYVRGPR